MRAMQVSVDIRRSPEVVFAYMTDAANRPKWDTALVEMKQTSASAKGVGTTYRTVYRTMGVRLTWSATLTRYDLNRGVAYDVTSGSIRLDQQVTSAVTPGGTNLTFVTNFSARGVAALLTPFLKWSVGRQIRSNAFRLKELLETWIDRWSSNRVTIVQIEIAEEGLLEGAMWRAEAKVHRSRPQPTLGPVHGDRLQSGPHGQTGHYYIAVFDVESWLPLNHGPNSQPAPSSRQQRPRQSSETPAQSPRHACPRPTPAFSSALC